MNLIAFNSASLIDRVGASREALTASPSASVAATSRSASSAAAASLTRATWGRGSEDAVVYDVPRAGVAPPRVWASPAQEGDAISTLMARNRDLMSQDGRSRAYGPGEQWRGLGGALLKHFGETGNGYSQTMAEDRTAWLYGSMSHDMVAGLSPEEQAQRVADILSAQTAALDGVSNFAAKAGLTIKLNSGASVELNIVASFAGDSGLGAKVELTASGAMSDAERAAVAKLAVGLDRALEGLGSGDAVGVDLSGLMDYDRDVIASLDLVASNPMVNQPLGSFSLHLGKDKQSVALKGRDGEMRLSLDAGQSAGNASAPQRQAAIQRTLERMDSAAQRGHANATLLQQVKSAFTQLQEAAGVDDPAALNPNAATLVAGLADFDASFGGDTHLLNRFGTVNEAGNMRYQLSQKTETQEVGNGRQSTAQTLTEQLSADFRKAPRERMLVVTNGDYADTHIRDSSTVRTLVEAKADQITRVLRQTTAEQLKTVTQLDNHRVTFQKSWPSQTRLLERLQ